MKTPVGSAAKPEGMPNEPKLGPSDSSFKPKMGGQGNSALDNFAEDAKVKAPTQMEHISQAIGPEHLFGQNLGQPKPMHLSPKDFSPPKQGGFGEQDKVQMPHQSLDKPRFSKK